VCPARGPGTAEGRTGPAVGARRDASCPACPHPVFRGLPDHRPVAAWQQVHPWGYGYGAVGLGLARCEFLLAGTVDQAHLGCFCHQIGTGVRPRSKCPSRAGPLPSPGRTSEAPRQCAHPHAPSLRSGTEPGRRALRPAQGPTVHPPVPKPRRAAGTRRVLAAGLAVGSRPRMLPHLRLASGSNRRFLCKIMPVNEGVWYEMSSRLGRCPGTCRSRLVAEETTIRRDQRVDLLDPRHLIGSGCTRKGYLQMGRNGMPSGAVQSFWTAARRHGQKPTADLESRRD
jgi:hypothetical protein